MRCRVLSEALILSPDPDQPASQALRDEINTLTRRIRLQQFLIRGLALLSVEEYTEASTVFEDAIKLIRPTKTLRQYLDQTRYSNWVHAGRKMDPES